MSYEQTNKSKGILRSVYNDLFVLVEMVSVSFAYSFFCEGAVPVHDDTNVAKKNWATSRQGRWGPPTANVKTSQPCGSAAREVVG